MDRLASRKLWVVVLGMLLATWLRSRGLIDSADCATVLITGMVGYPIANVAQKAVEARREAQQ